MQGDEQLQTDLARHLVGRGEQAPGAVERRRIALADEEAQGLGAGAGRQPADHRLDGGYLVRAEPVFGDAIEHEGQAVAGGDGEQLDQAGADVGARTEVGAGRLDDAALGLVGQLGPGLDEQRERPLAQLPDEAHAQIRPERALRAVPRCTGAGRVRVAGQAEHDAQ